MKLERYGNAVVIRSDILPDGNPDTKLFTAQFKELGGKWYTKLKTENPLGWLFAGNKAGQLLTMVNTFNLQLGLPPQTQILEEGPRVEPADRPGSPGALMQAMSGFRPSSPGLSQWAGVPSSSSSSPSSSVMIEPVIFPSGAVARSSPVIIPVVPEGMSLTPFPTKEEYFVPSSDKYVDAAGESHFYVSAGLYAARRDHITLEQLLRYGSVDVGQWVLQNFQPLMLHVMYFHPDNDIAYMILDKSDNTIQFRHNIFPPKAFGAYDFKSKSLLDVTLVDKQIVLNNVALQQGFGPGQNVKIYSPFDTYVPCPSSLNFSDNLLLRLFTEMGRLTDPHGMVFRHINNQLQQFILIAEVGLSGQNKAYRVFLLNGQLDAVFSLIMSSPSLSNLMTNGADSHVTVKEFVVIMSSIGPSLFYIDGRNVENMLLETDIGFVSLSGYWSLLKRWI